MFHGEQAIRFRGAPAPPLSTSALHAAPLAAPRLGANGRHVGVPEEGPNAAEPQSRDGFREPERQLWCAVIIHTLYEAAGRIGYAERGEHDGVRREAIAWFEDASEDFQAVCELAGFAPDAVRCGALRAIDSGRLPRMRISKAG